MIYTAMRDELEKISETNYYEAAKAIKRLKELEENKPKADEVARGALAGGLAGTAAMTAGNITSGSTAKGIREALKAPTIKGKVGRLGASAAKSVGSSLAGSAAFGSVFPFARSHLDQASEKAKLKNYLGVSKGGKTREKAKQILGV